MQRFVTFHHSCARRHRIIIGLPNYQPLHVDPAVNEGFAVMRVLSAPTTNSLVLRVILSAASLTMDLMPLTSQRPMPGSYSNQHRPGITLRTRPGNPTAATIDWNKWQAAQRRFRGSRPCSARPPVHPAMDTTRCDRLRSAVSAS